MRPIRGIGEEAGKQGEQGKKEKKEVEKKERKTYSPPSQPTYVPLPIQRPNLLAPLTHQKTSTCLAYLPTART